MDYMHAVGYRICLEMINQRLLNNYYRRPEAVMWDIRLVLSNAVAFNEPSSNVVRDAGKIVALFETHYARLGTKQKHVVLTKCAVKSSFVHRYRAGARARARLAHSERWQQQQSPPLAQD